MLDDQLQNQDAPEEKNDQCTNCDEYKEKWLRAHADYQNLQKEVSAQKAEWVQWSKAQVLEDFLPIYSNFKKAFSHEVKAGEDTQKQWESWKQGIGFIMKQFGDILKQHGLEEIKTVGEQFNATYHEAVGEEVSDEYGDGVIIREVETGYCMGEKVIRPAKVIINNRKSI